jgi:5'-phosphate synthase pdxT subunit
VSPRAEAAGGTGGASVRLLHGLPGAASGEGPRVGVLALQGDVREHVRALLAVGAEPVSVRRPAELTGLDGLIVPGGESTAMGRLLRVSGLLEPLADAVRGGLPTYGSCAGMVLLSRQILDGRPDQPALGALDIVVRRNAFGRQVDSFEADLPVVGLEAPLHAVFIRAPWVDAHGEDVQVLASVLPPGADDGPAAARPVMVRQGAVLASSFHPELSPDLRVHQLFVGMITGERAESGTGTLAATEATG